jgi:hypothetical protein
MQWSAAASKPENGSNAIASGSGNLRQSNAAASSVSGDDDHLDLTAEERPTTAATGTIVAATARHAPDARSGSAATVNGKDPPKRDRKHPLDYFIAFFLVLTFIATAFAACYTRKQWITADDAEKRSLRAYLIAENARFSRNKDGTLEYGHTQGDGSRELLVLYDVINEGVTPAYDVTQQVGIKEPFYHKKN